MPSRFLPPLPLRKEGGCIIRGDFDVGSCVTPGKKYDPENPDSPSEDFILHEVDGSNVIGAVCDGHGGLQCSRHCGQLIMKVAGDRAGKDKPISVSWSGETFEIADRSWEESPNHDESGTTATLCLVREDDISVAHVGDSTACVVNADAEAHVLTKDHLACDPFEAALVRERGGHIVDSSGADSESRVNDVLAVTRALGDTSLKPAVSNHPDVICIQRTPEQQVLIVATDGFWCKVSFKQAAKLTMDCVRKDMSMKETSFTLVKKAFTGGSTDDIGVLVVRLNPPTHATSTSPAPPPTVRTSPPLSGTSSDTSSPAPECSAPPTPDATHPPAVAPSRLLHDLAPANADTHPGMHGLNTQPAAIDWDPARAPAALCGSAATAGDAPPPLGAACVEALAMEGSHIFIDEPRGSHSGKADAAEAEATKDPQGACGPETATEDCGGTGGHAEAAPGQAGNETPAEGRAMRHTVSFRREVSVVPVPREERKRAAKGEGMGVWGWLALGAAVTGVAVVAGCLKVRSR